VGIAIYTDPHLVLLGLVWT